MVAESILPSADLGRIPVGDWRADDWPVADDGVGSALSLAARLGAVAPLPAGGSTLERWELLAQLGAHDLTVARAVEPHLDAIAILAEAGLDPGHGSYGVWAAEGPGARLEARRGGSDDQESWLLHGVKPWCSLAGHVDRALVTAWLDDSRRALFEVDATHPGVEVDAGSWAPHGLRRIVTSTISADAVPARMVGEPEWYLRRAGFAWGGVGVAAIWLGAAHALHRRLGQAARRREPDQIALMHLGEGDAGLWAAATALEAVAEAADRRSGPAGTADTAAATHESVVLAGRARLVVARAAEETLVRVGHALGPGPLAGDPEHADRVADLTLYLRQHHAERDAAALGRDLLTDADGQDERA